MPVALALSLVDALWNLSLRQVTLLIQRVTAAVLVGGVGGFFGGLIGHSLANVASPAGPGLGWAVAGALIGVAPAVFDLMVAASSGWACAGRRARCSAVCSAGPRRIPRRMLAVLLAKVCAGAFASKPPDRLDRLWSPGAIPSSPWGRA